MPESPTAPSPDLPPASDDAIKKRTNRRQRLCHCAVGTLASAATAVVIVAGVLSVGGHFAARAWPCELMCHFRLQYFVALVVCGVVLAVLRRWRWSLAACCLAGLNGWTLWPYVPFSATPDVLASSPLRVVSANVYSGNPTPDRLIAYVRDARPDILVALEVTPAWEQRLSALHDEFPHRVVQSRPGNFGIALLSRLPIREQSFAPLSESNSAIVAAIDLEGAPVTIIAAHPYPPGGSRNTQLRNLQLAELGRLADAVDGSCIVAGDLNVTPFSPAFDRLLAAGRLRDPRRGNGLLPTWPAGRRVLQIPIDHCLARDRTTLAIGPDVGSDHLPLQADIWCR